MISRVPHSTSPLNKLGKEPSAYSQIRNNLARFCSRSPRLQHTWRIPQRRRPLQPPPLHLRTIELRYLPHHCRCHRPSCSCCHRSRSAGGCSSCSCYPKSHRSRSCCQCCVQRSLTCSCLQCQNHTVHLSRCSHHLNRSTICRSRTDNWMGTYSRAPGRTFRRR